jgi:hypothetical protein
MKMLAILGEALPILGTLGLLGLWLYQQVDVEARSDELRNLSAAYSVYQTYQSNNAVFNAIIEVAGKNPQKTAKIRRFQMYNYEEGLAGIEAALPAKLKARVPAPVDAYDETEDAQAKMDRLRKSGSPSCSRNCLLRKRMFAPRQPLPSGERYGSTCCFRSSRSPARSAAWPGNSRWRRCKALRD